MLAALILAASLVLKPSDIQSIHLKWTWGGLGTPKRVQVDIAHTGDAFVRSDGSVVPEKDIDAFVASVNDPGHLPIPVGKMGITLEYMRSQIPIWEPNCIGDLPKDSNVAKSFERKFTNLALIEEQYNEGLAIPRHLLDDYPRFEAAIATSSGAFSISSDSVNRHMLPLHIVRPDGSAFDSESWDLMPAVRTLLAFPQGPSDAFGGDDRGSISGNWASWSCDTQAVTAVSSAAPKALIKQVARELGVSVGEPVQNGDPRWGMRATFPGQQLLADVYTTAKIANVVRTDFLKAQSGAAIVASIPWIKNALQSNPNGRLIFEGIGGTFAFLPDMAVKAGRRHAAALLSGDRDAMVRVTMYDASIKGSGTNWVVLRDGTMILVEYAGGAHGFPFGRDMTSIAPPIDIGGAGLVYAATIVHPDGAIETASP